MGQPPWMGKEEPTRKRSGRQEKKLAEKFGGRTTSGSGSVFTQNDLITPQFDIEAKTTHNKGYRITLEELKQIRIRCRTGKIPLQVIEMQGKSFAVIGLDDFLELLGLDSLE